MMARTDLSPGAARLISCAEPKPGESVVLVTDSAMPAEVVAAFEAALAATGCDLCTVMMQPRAQSGGEPHRAAGAALMGADLGVEVTSNFVHHSRARNEAQLAGMRYLFIGDIDAEMLGGPGAVFADFDAAAPRIKALQQRITDGDQMHIAAPSGTDLTVDLTERPGRGLTGFAREPGTFGAPPCLEAGLVPKVGGSEGKVVVDLFAVGIGLLDEPFEVEVRDGRAVNFSGGRHAAVLESMLVGAKNDNAFNVSEIGIGMNDQALMIDNVTSAEAVYGTAHVALGSTPSDLNIEIIHAGIHLDLVFDKPTISIDGDVVMQDGEISPNAL